MDQESLAREQIDAGQKFLDAFGKRAPVKVAFWLKTSDDSDWYLFVALDGFKFEDMPRLYTEVFHASKEIEDPNFDQFQVRLVSAGTPLAQAALGVYRRYPTSIPTHLRGGSFGGMDAEGVYIYPPAVPVR